MSGIANEQNLKPFTSEQSREAAVKNGTKGGAKTAENKRRKKGIREAMQALLDTEYHLKDKATGEVKTMTGEEAIALGILNTAMNPKDKNWKAAVQYALQLNGDDKSKTEQKLIKAQAKMLKAKADLLTGADTTTLDKLDEILKEMRDDAIKGGDE